MIYKHQVKYNGKYYPAGADVPVGVKPVDDKKVQDDSADTSTKGVIMYTKTDINRMSTSDLKSLAKSEGIKDADTLSGADLKKVLIEKFGL